MEPMIEDLDWAVLSLNEVLDCQQLVQESFVAGQREYK
jgi:hypothetical protein